MSLTEVANALENHPDARPYHKLLALEASRPAGSSPGGSIRRRRCAAFRKRGDAWHKLTREARNLPMKRSSPWLGG